MARALLVCGREVLQMFAALQLLCIAVSSASLTLAGCIAFFSARRERSESLWCEPRQQQTIVTFIERTGSGMVLRTMLDCPLRQLGERCSETCLSPCTMPAGGVR